MNKPTDVSDVLHQLAQVAPVRLTGTPGERALQDALAARLRAIGYRTEWQPFRFPRHIYGSLALHFGLALALLALGQSHPIAGAVGIVVVAASFYSEAVLRRHVLRRLWPAVATQNLLMTLPASTPLRKRIVFVAHADSAFTGLLFHPRVLPLLAKPPPAWLPFLKKQLLLPWVALLAIATTLVAGTFTSLPAWPLAVAAVPIAIVFAFNLEILLRNRPVPGAADNLSGCAALVVLAEAWAAAPIHDVEVVFAFTGAEEAGTGGATFLARHNAWPQHETDIIVLDTLSNGSLFLLEEGELFRMRRVERLAFEVAAAARSAGLPAPAWYSIPAGATDALPFLIEGYDALALTCIDTAYHAPQRYHHPTDTAEHVDPVQLAASTEIAKALLERLAGQAVGELSAAA